MLTTALLRSDGVEPAKTLVSCSGEEDPVRGRGWQLRLVTARLGVLGGRGHIRGDGAGEAHTHAVSVDPVATLSVSS